LGLSSQQIHNKGISVVVSLLGKDNTDLHSKLIVSKQSDLTLSKASLTDFLTIQPLPNGTLGIGCFLAARGSIVERIEGTSILTPKWHDRKTDEGVLCRSL
jgi:hypothetical protein